MSNKPPKHSELKKKETAAKRMRGSWGKSRAAAPSIRIRPERFLIVTEGTRTEPLYFEGFRRRINAAFRGEYVTLRVYGVGANTVSLFDQAKSIAEADPDGFTQVWVVYDKDSFPARDFNVVVDLCASASGEGVAYRAAWTNEAFELWYILALHVHRLRAGKRIVRAHAHEVLARGWGGRLCQEPPRHV